MYARNQKDGYRVALLMGGAPGTERPLSCAADGRGAGFCFARNDNSVLMSEEVFRAIAIPGLRIWLAGFAGLSED